MPENNRPRGREKNITGSASVNKRGEGLGTGPVGTGTGRNSAPTQRASGTRATTKKAGLPTILVVILALLFGGKGFFSSSGTTTDTTAALTTPAPASSYTTPAPSSSTSTGSILSGLTASYSGAYASGMSSGWSMEANTSKLDETVDENARDRYTTIKGNGKDVVTIMVYMCGTDLESQSGMATSDLQEMASATLSDKVNVLIYTGGCRSWKNNVISSSTNQIYKLESGGSFKRLVSDAGNVSMVKPSTLTYFINYCAENYPANRNMLIFWDHGGGSVSGYGYDEKFSSSGSMTLKGINEALSGAGVKFDMIGFDACLMATAENALMLSNYADYMVASEETEPGVGWYYKNWLSALCKNTSMPTIQIGKNIVDDFVDVCAQQTRGQKTTLSVVDLAELEATMPEQLRSFAESTLEMIQSDNYKSVSNARSGAREFSSSSKIDQVDLVSFTYALGTDDANELADAILGAIKYNRTSSDMTDAYGLSIYFPYRKMSYVSSAVSTYDAIGIDDEYSECIQAFASVEASGQAASGGTNSALQSLFGDYYSTGSSSSGGWSDSYSGYGSSSYSGYGSGSYSGYGSSGSSGYSGYSSGSYSGYGYNNGYSSSSSSSSSIYDLLFAMMGGSSSGVSGISGSSGSFYGRSIDLENTAEYISSNLLDSSALVWTLDAAGNKVLSLSEEQWSLVHDLDLSVYYDDGEGYIDLGLDNVFDFTDAGALKGEYDNTWLAVNGQVVAYYHTDTLDDGENYAITGYIPALVNSVRANLIVVFDNDNPNGYITAVEYDYRNGETETTAKSAVYFGEGKLALSGSSDTTAEPGEACILKPGDVIEFVCDYYTYAGEYSDSYYLGDPMIYDGDIAISNVYLEGAGSACAMYRLTDIYNQQYWTAVIR